MWIQRAASASRRRNQIKIELKVSDSRSMRYSREELLKAFIAEEAKHFKDSIDTGVKILIRFLGLDTRISNTTRNQEETDRNTPAL